MKSTATKLYNGPIDKASGKTASRMRVFIVVIVAPAFDPLIRNGTTMGISHT
jgi:hypothetical protein